MDSAQGDTVASNPRSKGPCVARLSTAEGTSCGTGGIVSGGRVALDPTALPGPRYASYPSRRPRPPAGSQPRASRSLGRRAPSRGRARCPRSALPGTGAAAARRHRDRGRSGGRCRCRPVPVRRGRSLLTVSPGAGAGPAQARSAAAARQRSVAARCPPLSRPPSAASRCSHRSPPSPTGWSSAAGPGHCLL